MCVCVCVCVFVCVFVYMNYINNQYEIKKVYIYIYMKLLNQLFLTISTMNKYSEIFKEENQQKAYRIT